MTGNLVTYKTVAFGSACVLVSDHDSLKNVSKLFEEAPQRVTLRLPGKSSHENLRVRRVAHLVSQRRRWRRMVIIRHRLQQQKEKRAKKQHQDDTELRKVNLELPGEQNEDLLLRDPESSCQENLAR